MSFSDARLTAIRYLPSRAVPLLLSQVSDKRLIVLMHILERVARTDHHKAQLAYLRQMVEDQHPSIELARRILALRPNARRRAHQRAGDQCNLAG